MKDKDLVHTKEVAKHLLCLSGSKNVQSTFCTFCAFQVHLMMAFSDLIQKYALEKNNLVHKSQQIFSPSSLNVVGILLGDGPFLCDNGMVNLHSSKGTHRVTYMYQNDFGSYGGPKTEKLSKFFIKRNEFGAKGNHSASEECLYSREEIQGLRCKRDSPCAA